MVTVFLMASAPFLSTASAALQEQTDMTTTQVNHPLAPPEFCTFGNQASLPVLLTHLVMSPLSSRHGFTDSDVTWSGTGSV